MSRTTIVIFIFHRHKPIERINLLGSWLRYEHYPSCALNKRQDNVQNCDSYINIPSLHDNLVEEMNIE
jgi:hypothetical protein